MNYNRLAALVGVVFCISAAPAVAQGWGAFALSSTGAFGWSSNYETKEGAEERALQECGKNARDCAVRRSFQNGCLSVALSSQRVGWAWSGNKARRDSAAINSCNKEGTPPCTLRVSFCSGVQDEAEPSQPSQPPSGQPPAGDPPAGQPTPGPKE